MTDFEYIPEEEKPETPDKKNSETEDKGGEKLIPKGKTSEQDDQLRLREHEVKLNNQQIIEFAYLTKKVIEVCIEGHSKLFVEQANCYVHCFYTVRKMLEAVELEYGERHGNLMNFFRKGRELSTDYDTLHFISPGEKDAGVIDPLSESDLQENIKSIRDEMGTRFFQRKHF
jgi:hypothetical protein